MRKLFESANSDFLDVETKIKEELNCKAIEEIEKLEEQTTKDMMENDEEVAEVDMEVAEEE